MTTLNNSGVIGTPSIAPVEKPKGTAIDVTDKRIRAVPMKATRTTRVTAKTKVLSSTICAKYHIGSFQVPGSRVTGDVK